MNHSPPPGLPVPHEHRYGAPGRQRAYLAWTWASICQEPWCYERRPAVGPQLLTPRELWDDRPWAGEAQS